MRPPLVSIAAACMLAAVLAMAGFGLAAENGSPPAGSFTPMPEIGMRGTSENGVTPTEIRIGQWGPQTGSQALWGAVLRGTDAFFRMVNDEGGINGRTLTLIGIDDGYDPKRTQAGVQALVEKQEVFAFVGGVGTSAGLAVMDYLDGKGVPWLAPVSGSSRLTAPPKKWVFGLFPTYRDQAAALVKYCVDDLSRKSVAIFYTDGGGGQDALEGAKLELNARGLDFAAEPVPVSGDDLPGKGLADVIQASPDAILLWVTPSQAIRIRKAAADAGPGFNPLWLTGPSLADTGLMNKATGGLWAGTIFTGFFEFPDSRNPLMQKYRQAYDKYAGYGERWSVYFYTGCGLAELLTEALKKAGPDLTRENFISALESLRDFPTIFGPVTYGPNDRQGLDRFYIAQALHDDRNRLLTGWFSPDRIGLSRPPSKTVP